MKHSHLLCLAAALALALVACGGAQKTGGAVTGGQDNSPAALLQRYQHLLPANTGVFIKLDMRRITQDHMVDAFGLIQSDWDHAAMLRDISKISSERLQMDLTRANWCVMAGSRDEGVFFCDDAVALKKPALSEAINDNVTLVGRAQNMPTPSRGMLDKIYAFKKERVYLVPLQRDSVPQGLAGATPAAAGYLGKLLDRVGDGDLVFASNPDLLKDAMPSPEIQEAGFAVSVSDRLVVVLHGDEAVVKAESLALDGHLETMRQELGEKLKDGERLTTDELLATTWAWHVLAPLSRAVRPTREAQFLVYDVPMDTVTHPVTVLGAVGAVIYFVFLRAFMDMGDRPVMAPPAGAQPPPPVP
jgi:hypothetical protein